MIKSRSFKFLKNKHLFNYCTMNTEESKNYYEEKNDNINLYNSKLFSHNLKLKIVNNLNLNNIKQIKIKENSNKKKLKIFLPEISYGNIKQRNKESFSNKESNKKRIYSSSNLKPKNYKIGKYFEDKKLSIDKLLNLRKKFSSKIKMSKGEIVEMTYGNKIMFDNNLDLKVEENKRIKEILYNNPKFIIDLIEFGYVNKQEINEFFNIESFNILWNENLEKSYREIRKINSNIFKIISFLSKTGLLRKLKKNYESKNFIDFYNYNIKEIEKIYDIYEKLKEYEYNKIKEAFEKIDNIYLTRDILLKEKISKIRKEYFSNKLKHYQEMKKSKIDLKELIDKGKAELIEIKNCIFHVRQNTDWKIFPSKKINRLKFSKSMTKYNEIIKKEMNIKNIEFKDKIKKEKIYLKERINLLKSKKVFEKSNFNLNKFMKENEENKRIIEYYIVIVQSNFRGYIVRIFLGKLIKGINDIINNLYEYTKFKQLILTLYKKSFELIELNDNSVIFGQKIKEINNVTKIMIKNCRTRKLIFKKNEVEIINKIIKYNIGLLPIKEDQEIYSNIPLINLNKFLTYIKIK